MFVYSMFQACMRVVWLVVLDMQSMLMCDVSCMHVGVLRLTQNDGVGDVKALFFERRRSLKHAHAACHHVFDN
jgi:hypothetical protein